MKNNRSSRITISKHTLFVTMPIVALLAWGALLLFVNNVPPQSVWSFIVFFALLGVALFCTLAPLIHLATRKLLARRISGPTTGHALRQALLLDIFIVFNLFLRVLHSWSLFTALVSLGIVVIVELLALSGK